MLCPKFLVGGCNSDSPHPHSRLFHYCCCQLACFMSIYQLSSCHLQYCTHSLFVYEFYTHPSPSIWIILMSDSCSRKVSLIRSCIWKAEILGLFGSKTHTMAFCLSPIVLRYTALFNPLHSYVTPPGTTTNARSRQLVLDHTPPRLKADWIEPATFRYVAQHLDHCATAAPRHIVAELKYEVQSCLNLLRDRDVLFFLTYLLKLSSCPWIVPCSNRS